MKLRRPALGPTVRGALLTAFLVLALPASPAAADPAVPTDRACIIDAISPAAPGIEITFPGGDTFVELRVDPGVTARVPGYENEPYLEVLADGTVRENQMSPTKWLNETRYGTSAGPAEADAEAAPDWKIIGRSGSVMWHDHRLHPMNRTGPTVTFPADDGREVVQAWTLDLVVNDQPVTVTGRTYLRNKPSPIVWLVGAVALVNVGVVARRSARAGLVYGGLLAILAAAVAGHALTVPALLAAQRWTVVLPLVALALAVAGLLREWILPVAGVCVAILLGMWAWQWRATVSNPIVPTGWPIATRLAVTACVGGAVALLVTGLPGLLRRPPPSE